MAWTPITVFPGQPTRAVEANTIQANITAQANGDPGAPKQQLAGMANNSVDSAQIVSGAVHQSELSTATADYGTSRSAPNIFTAPVVSASGGFGLSLGTLDNDEPNDIWGALYSNMGNLQPGIVYGVAGVDIDAASNGMVIRERYVTASPPFNLGHGDCSLFTFVKLKNNEVVSSYSSIVPPWAYNGPTSIRPDEVALIEGKLKKYKYLKDSSILAPWDGGDEKEYFESKKSKKREIDHDLKNADMSLIPHPFTLPKNNEKILLIDPCSSISDQLQIVQEKEEISIPKLLNGGHLQLGDILDCNAPSGVCVVSANWKKTK